MISFLKLFLVWTAGDLAGSGWLQRPHWLIPGFGAGRMGHITSWFFPPSQDLFPLKYFHSLLLRRCSQFTNGWAFLLGIRTSFCSPTRCFYGNNSRKTMIVFWFFNSNFVPRKWDSHNLFFPWCKICWKFTFCGFTLWDHNSWILFNSRFYSSVNTISTSDLFSKTTEVFECITRKNWTSFNAYWLETLDAS